MVAQIVIDREPELQRGTTHPYHERVHNMHLTGKRRQEHRKIIQPLGNSSEG
jgi:hypothetical protein